MISMMTTTTTKTTSILRSRAPLAAIRRLHAGRVVFDCCSRAAPEVRLTKVPRCFWRCVEMRVRAHAVAHTQTFHERPWLAAKAARRRAGWRVIHLTRYTRFLRRFLRFPTYSLPPVGATPPGPAFTFIYLQSSVVVPRSCFRNWTTTMKTIK